MLRNEGYEAYKKWSEEDYIKLETKYSTEGFPWMAKYAIKEGSMTNTELLREHLLTSVQGELVQKEIEKENLEN